MSFGKDLRRTRKKRWRCGCVRLIFPSSGVSDQANEMWSGTISSASGAVGPAHNDGFVRMQHGHRKTSPGLCKTPGSSLSRFNPYDALKSGLLQFFLSNVSVRLRSWSGRWRVPEWCRARLIQTRCWMCDTMSSWRPPSSIWKT